MPGTKEGARKAAAKNLAKDPDFYKRIGQKGGQNGNTGGFAYTAIYDPEGHKRASSKGGSVSRKTK